MRRRAVMTCCRAINNENSRALKPRIFLIANNNERERYRETKKKLNHQCEDASTE